MTLAEIVRQLDSVDRGNTIYMRRPWSSDAECDLAAQGEPGSQQDSRLTYFLEVHVAIEVLEVFDDRPGPPPTEEEKVRLLMFYAENDAFPDWVYVR